PPPPPPPPPPPATPPSETAKPQAEPPRSRAFRPVLEFADKDSAPKEKEQGEPQQAEASKPPITDVKPEEAPVESPQPEKPQISETMPATTPVPQDIELPQVETAEANPEKNGPAATGQDQAKTNFEQSKPPENTTVPAPSTPPKVEAKEADKMIKAKTLFSEKVNASPTIKTAISNLPRGERINQLCQTELRQQLIHSAAQYQPRWLPSYSLLSGSVLDARRGAFKSRNEWFEVRFRCELDDDATKVIAFEFDVGNSVPRSEWKSRRFPED
ncbi:DUF930 domain-containing protein, partial [Rhizobium phaseoli]|uniref:DUF930 domain-containing protein n=1 Tax=Rhizobium phaseoli TaxID=396 RepID=UPI0019549416